MTSVSGIPSSYIIGSRDLSPALPRIIISDSGDPAGRPSAGKKTDTSALNKIFTSLCPGSPWNDINLNGHIELLELSNVNASAIELFNRIDLNGDGISLHEIKSYTGCGADVEIQANTAVIYNALKANGSYKMKGLPVEFVTEDKIPAGAAEMESYTTLTGILKEGSLVTMAYSKGNGRVGRVTEEGAKKLCLIVVPKFRLEPGSRANTERLIKHELVHARQYLSGKRAEFLSLNEFIARSGKFGLVDMEKPLPRTICEIEAWKINLNDAVSDGDPYLMSDISRQLNSEIETVKQALNLFRDNNEDGLCDLLKSMLAEVLTQNEAKKINNRIEKVMKNGRAAIKDLPQ